MSRAKQKGAEAPAAALAPPKKTEVNITAAKGRPMLTWVGKRPLSYVTAFPAQHVETYAPSPPPTLPRPGASVGDRGKPEESWKDWPATYPQGGLLFHGDNKEVLAHLLANGFRGKVNLIYIDPPFDSGADYVRKVEPAGRQGNGEDRRRELHLGRADPVYGHLGERQLPAVHVREAPDYEGVTG